MKAVSLAFQGLSKYICLRFSRFCLGWTG